VGVLYIFFALSNCRMFCKFMFLHFWQSLPSIVRPVARDASLYKANYVS